VSVRNVLLVLNAVALLALAAYAVMALRRSPEPKAAPNLGEPLSDEVLEGRRLERVQGWALVFAAVIAVALPAYWVREPTRQDESIAYFDDGAVERGTVLFANDVSEEFDSAVSLQCANCHGVDATGGSAPYVYTPPGGGPADVVRLAWAAPALDTVLLRFSEDEVRDIITFGRPGTPMQPWGTLGGGPKNEQAINDLVAFIRSIQITPEEAQQQAADRLDAARDAADDAVDTAEEALDAARDALDTAEQARDDLADDATPKQVADAEAAVVDASRAVDRAERTLAWAQDWATRRADVSDGQLLFELYCARCHTKGWSIFDPTRPNGTQVLGLAGGGGTLGFNLRDGDAYRRFGTGTTGSTAQAEFVALGTEEHKPYGIGGLGSGRMPGFGSMLTAEMIEQIVDYERNHLDDTTYLADENEE
jgi:mono/diheme cytochrome c family protein